MPGVWAGLLEEVSGFEKLTLRFKDFWVPSQSTFSDFLRSYSGIVELVKAADSQYGGLAYGTLSLLLSVSCVAKIEIAGWCEEGRSSQRTTGRCDRRKLEELGLNFPRLEILDHIYPSTRIRELVVLIYKDVIKFARESATYYQQSSTSK